MLTFSHTGSNSGWRRSGDTLQLVNQTQTNTGWSELLLIIFARPGFIAKVVSTAIVIIPTLLAVVTSVTIVAVMAIVAKEGLPRGSLLSLTVPHDGLCSSLGCVTFMSQC